MTTPPITPYLSFTRQEWAMLRDGMPMTLGEQEVLELRGINSALDMDEVIQIYLPLSRLLHLYVHATQQLFGATATFLGHDTPKVPYIIGLAGSVAAGKSTAGRLLQALLSHLPAAPKKVELVTTDGFLRPNAELQAAGLMERKGFPESYDQEALLRFVSALKAGKPHVHSPVYSHLAYDILPGVHQEIHGADVVILEGLNVLQSSKHPGHVGRAFVSDFFDFSIYMDADLADLRHWYIARFLTLRDTAFHDPQSYFHRYAGLPDEDSRAFALSVWERINEVNLFENILPTRERASLVLKKGHDHKIEQIRLRKI